MAGATIVDANVADYVRSVCGEGMRTEGWELIARAGQPHKLQVRIIVQPGALLPVIEKLIPHVTYFSAGLIQGGPDNGFVEITAPMLVDVRTLLTVPPTDPADVPLSNEE